MPRPVVPIRALAGGGFAELVQLAMQRQDQGGVLGDAQILGVDHEPCCLRVRYVSTRPTDRSDHALPMDARFPLRTTLDGNRDQLEDLIWIAPSVCPALCPP